MKKPNWLTKFQKNFDILWNNSWVKVILLCLFMFLSGIWTIIYSIFQLLIIIAVSVFFFPFIFRLTKPQNHI